jgi:hypothetical protein
MFWLPDQVRHDEFGLSTNSNSSRFHNRLFLKVISGYSAAKRHNLAFYEFINFDRFKKRRFDRLYIKNIGGEF